METSMAKMCSRVKMAGLCFIDFGDVDVAYAATDPVVLEEAFSFTEMVRCATAIEFDGMEAEIDLDHLSGLASACGDAVRAV